MSELRLWMTLLVELLLEPHTAFVLAPKQEVTKQYTLVSIACFDFDKRAYLIQNFYRDALSISSYLVCELQDL